MHTQGYTHLQAEVVVGSQQAQQFYLSWAVVSAGCGTGALEVVGTTGLLRPWGTGLEVHLPGTGLEVHLLGTRLEE